jgi:hypothetical protein
VAKRPKKHSLNETVANKGSRETAAEEIRMLKVLTRELIKMRVRVKSIFPLGLLIYRTYSAN